MLLSPEKNEKTRRIHKEPDYEEEHGTISNEEWKKLMEETLRKDRNLLEKLAKI